MVPITEDVPTVALTGLKRLSPKVSVGSTVRLSSSGIFTVWMTSPGWNTMEPDSAT